jgi:hypothetical protein
MLSACVAPQVSDRLPPATPGQSFHAADAAYASVLEIAVAYKDQCVKTPTEFQGNCKDIVNTLRRINGEAQEIRGLGEMALAEDDAAMASAAADRLEILRDRLRNELQVQMLINGHKPEPE